MRTKARTKKGTTKKGTAEKRKKETNLTWIMQLEGVNLNFLLQRLNVQEHVSYDKIQKGRVNNKLLSEPVRKDICRILNRPYEEVFGNVRPLAQLMIAPKHNYLDSSFVA